MQAMLAASLKTPEKLRFPLLASPKLDGVRAFVLDGRVMSRNTKPIPNAFVQSLWGRPELNGWDGELGVGDPTDPAFYRNTVSAIMSRGGEPDVFFHLFDDYMMGGVFRDRYQGLHDKLTKLRFSHVADNRATIVKHELVCNLQELDDYEAKALEAGYEGAMVRDLLGPYKNGRSTENEGFLLKVKRFHDMEAIVWGFDEKMHNANPAGLNELGRTHRTSHKAGKQATGVLGSLKVRGLSEPYKDIEFDIGTGFSDAEREMFWNTRGVLVGRIVKVKYFPSGSKDKPRFPTFLGFREDV